jgi:hypothetical protein
MMAVFIAGEFASARIGEAHMIDRPNIHMRSLATLQGPGGQLKTDRSARDTSS